MEPEETQEGTYDGRETHRWACVPRTLSESGRTKHIAVYRVCCVSPVTYTVSLHDTATRHSLHQLLLAGCRWTTMCRVAMGGYSLVVVDFDSDTGSSILPFFFGHGIWRISAHGSRRPQRIRQCAVRSHGLPCPYA
eukprot:7486299-Pyramimonas_sp.AAC.1